MAANQNIPIKNIYYMLTYAFQVLRQTHYSNIAAEEFKHTEDLFAAILAAGLAQQVKQGLYREYTTQHETLTTLRGKLDIHNTIQARLQRKQLLSCHFDELSEDNLYNRTLKTTAVILMRMESVSPQRRTALRNALLYFDSVSTTNPHTIPWTHLCVPHSNRTYRMLLQFAGLFWTTCFQPPSRAAIVWQPSLTSTWQDYMNASFWNTTAVITHI